MDTNSEKEEQHSYTECPLSLSKHLSGITMKKRRTNLNVLTLRRIDAVTALFRRPWSIENHSNTNSSFKV